MTTKTQAEYLQSYGQCPYCDSDEIEGDSVEIDGNAAYQQMSCKACERYWKDFYVLAYYLSDIEKAKGPTTWTITQPATGIVLGEFEGADEREALLAMAKDAGYDSIKEMDVVTGTDNLEELHFS